MGQLFAVDIQGRILIGANDTAKYVMTDNPDTGGWVIYSGQGQGEVLAAIEAWGANTTEDAVKPTGEPQEGVYLNGTIETNGEVITLTDGQLNKILDTYS